MKIPKLVDITITLDVLLFIIGITISIFLNITIGVFILGVSLGYDMKDQIKRLKHEVKV